jgi:competence ComEA-like helix-hairpin-helix protein
MDHRNTDNGPPTDQASSNEASLPQGSPLIIDRPDIQRLFLILALLLLVLGASKAVTAVRIQGNPLQEPNSTGFQVNVNLATAEELSLLPQVGPVLADRIVAERELHGPFRSLDDLGRTRGIGPDRISELRPLITIDR